ncbi:MAG: beta/gamma crystallin-related protein [Casimicrobiaceae bacterium]
MNTTRLAALGVATALFASVATAQVTLYQQENFRGPTFATGNPVSNLDRLGFNDRASSAIVDRGTWQMCEDSEFRGRCIVLRPGQYPSLSAMGLNNSISSLRRVSGPNYAYAPPPPPPVPQPYPYYPRSGERLFQAPVVAVRAVTGPPEQRCWTEPQQVVAPSQPNVPGAIIGGILGGVLGHQIGSGRGNDVATAVGAVGGVAIGANVDRGGPQTYTQNVQRCSAVPGSGQVAYYDVTYNFQGTTHRAQLSFAPGATITVNGRGEPRV